jgi:hypothetical protein
MAKQKPVSEKKSTRGKQVEPKTVIPLTEEKSIIQPLTVLMMKQEYTVIQNRAVFCIVSKFQEEIHELIKQGKYHLNDIQTKEFNTDGPTLKIYMKEFGVGKNNYKDLREALKLLATVSVQLPTRDVNGKKYNMYTNLCTVFLPSDTYSNYVVIKLEKEIANNLISLDFGYQNIYPRVILNTKTVYTQKLYTMINAWKNKGSFTITTQELRQQLNCENKYKLFRQLAASILDKTQAELKKMCDEGNCDCYYDYEKIYLSSKKTGEPDKIQFNIHLGKIFINDSVVKKIEENRKTFIDLAIHHFFFTNAKAEQYSKLIDTNNYSGVIAKMMDILQYTDKIKEHEGKNAYATKSLDEYFSQYQQYTEFEEQIK